ncbi:nucleotidyltransferase domain-containing protein [Halobacillus sp. BBL2006]|uniref:nucleotidyltransferase domain-containing protein n=1 Tax=Halobacillus sp. BBL2006 TaxID=1543706 RepID=UPI0005421689|nr:hypothetical protein [Halobacillus sp. BBL2006]KHE71902.1 hypothetical protein LD39_07370 [Halobacillus sp. BBL2006]
MFEPCLKVKEWLGSYPCKWMIAGGWAIDLHIGEETREHDDIEVVIFREDQYYLQDLLRGWEVKVAKNGKLVSWDLNNRIDPPVHEIHAFLYEKGHIEFLLNENKHERWTFRRDSTISYPFSSMNLQSEQGIPYLNPEIVLLYKAKHSREKDQADFHYVFPYLNEHQKEWLKQALMHHQPKHPWLEKLLY